MSFRSTTSTTERTKPVSVEEQEFSKKSGQSISYDKHWVAISEPQPIASIVSAVITRELAIADDNCWKIILIVGE